MRKLKILLIVAFASFSHLLCADNNYIEPVMVTIPAGKFLMGSQESDSEQPIHKVEINSFKLAKYVVTVKEFLHFVKATGHKATSKCFIIGNKGEQEEIPTLWGERNSTHGEFIPINCVSWQDTQAYIAWLNNETGKRYRLPSEAEWEYAARAGSTQKFYFGNDEQQICLHENGYDQTSALIGRDAQLPAKAIACDDGESTLSTVGIYQPNNFGLYDMLGNVSEWVADCYHPNYHGAPKTGDAWLDGECSTRFARGGSWATNAKSMASSFRPTVSPIKTSTIERRYDRGFRLALDMPAETAYTDQQKSFIAALEKAQKASITHKSFVIKKREALLETYKSWGKTPVIVPPMVNIPAGEFLMGSNLSPKEKPIHKVSVNAFKLSKYEVTIKQFKQFAAATNYITGNQCWKFVSEGGGPYKDGILVTPGDWLTPEYAPSDFHPVMCVSWDDANAYLAWLSQQTGKKYRLPTEAEWEYAAGAGSTTKYFFGDDDKDLCQYANIFDESGMRAFARDKEYKKRDMKCDDGAEYTTVVGMYKPNAFGLYDMIGNISEWVEDCDHPNYQGAPTDGSAWISEECRMRSRKGSTYGQGEGSHTTMRAHGGQNNRSSLGEGFRIAEDVQTHKFCSDSSDACKKVSSKQNTFEAELVKAQKIEFAKQNTKK